MENYQKKFDVDMSEYLWYFHTEEEGQNFGAIFFKPPYMRVGRIPITPKILTKFAKSKKWSIDYPDHKLPKKRYDIKINFFLTILIVLAIISYFIFSLFIRN